MRTFGRFLTGLAIGAVAIVAGVVSYSHIYGLSIELHQSPLVAALMPFGVDGLITVGSVVLLQGGADPWLGWLGVGPGVAVSVFANVESGIRYGALSATWAGIPALSFFLATFLLERWLKAQARGAPMGAPAVNPETVPEPDTEPATVAAVPATISTTRETPPKARVKGAGTRQPVAASGDMEKRAKRVLARQPDISGAELGRALGASPRTGQRLLAKLSDAAAA